MSAARFVFLSAVKAGHLRDSPAGGLSRPRRRRSPRHALSAEELAELFSAALATGRDAELDLLILAFAGNRVPTRRHPQPRPRGSAPNSVGDALREVRGAT